MLRSIPALVAIAALSVGVASAPAKPPAAATPDLPLTRGDFAGSFGIGHGRTMFLECIGKGSPTVVLDSGLRNGAAVWAERTAEAPPGPTVFPALARFTRVCGYDRPGTLNKFEPLEFSRSSPVAMPRTTAGAVSDLHALLEVARVPAPYVFVNHSTGGLIDRLYASTYPREVAGMVLVDALAEPLQSEFDRAQMDTYEQLNNSPVEGIDYPEIEQFDFRRSFAQLRLAERKRPFPAVPLSVLSHGLPFALPESLPGGLSSAVIEKAWTKAQDKLAGLTPDAVHLIAKRSSHYIMFSQPKLVIDQVKRVVRAARR